MSSERYRTMTVTATHEAATGIVFARLEDLAGGPLPPWRPGAHVEVRLPSSTIRHYSLCGDPADTRGYEIAVLREESGRGGSAEFHRDVGVDWSVEVGTPQNDFPFEPAPRYLFLAGGVGITPILPMVRAAQAAGADWRLVYGGRSRSSMAFLDALVELAPERVAVVAEDEKGRPDLAAELTAASPEARIYACGPGPMLDVVVAQHASTGTVATLHLERFGATATADVSGGRFEVVARRSGVSAVVGPDETILGALRPQIPDLLSSCEEGHCGTCETGVVEGEPDHRDSYLTPEERASGESIMICVSRCAGARLVIDA